MSRLWGRLNISRSYSYSRPAAYSDAMATAPPLQSANVDLTLSSAQGAPHDSVPEEVIRLICEYARAPFPEGGKSSYAAPSRESRREWRQPTLAALMRVNKVCSALIMMQSGAVRYKIQRLQGSNSSSLQGNTSTRPSSLTTSLHSLLAP